MVNEGCRSVLHGDHPVFGTGNALCQWRSEQRKIVLPAMQAQSPCYAPLLQETLAYCAMSMESRGTPKP